MLLGQEKFADPVYWEFAAVGAKRFRRDRSISSAFHRVGYGASQVSRCKSFGLRP
ncbi:hypothetical protein QO004_003073 [Rhizobium mesoamericanum]|nr:hypothetical protein [Rhizobium mesoamericanum]